MMWSHRKMSLFLACLLVLFSIILSHYSVNTLTPLDEDIKGEMGIEFYFSLSPEDDDGSESNLDNFPKSSVQRLNDQVERMKLGHLCPYYNNGTVLDLDKMADVWQTAYHTMPEDIDCFKIYIRQTSESEREELHRKYGTFGNSVNWARCLLEVKGSALDNTRKHYLMGDDTTKGVFENIVITEWETRNGQEHPAKGFLKRQAKAFYRSEDQPDQWRVFHNLLLMRDCMRGYVLVFSRHPRDARTADIYDALRDFGEISMDGKDLCVH